MPCRCVVYNCNSTGYSNTAKLNGQFSLHKFPVDPELNKIWNCFVASSRKDWRNNTVYSRICSAHFEEDCFSHDAVKRQFFPDLKSKWSFLKEGSVPTRRPVLPNKPASSNHQSPSSIWLPNAMDTSSLGSVNMTRGIDNIVNDKVVPDKKTEQCLDEYFMSSVSSESIQQEAELMTSESIADSQPAISVVAKIKEEPGVIVNTCTSAMDTSYLGSINLTHCVNNIVNNEVAPDKNEEQCLNEYVGSSSVTSESIQQEAELTIADNQPILVVHKIKEEPGVIVNTSEFSNTLASCEFKLECDADDSSVIDNSYSCDVGGKERSLNSTPTYHYSGDRPHKCDVCGQAFKQNSHLTRHLRVHTGEKPFSCNVCRKEFAEKSNLKDHYKTHSRANPFKCHVCNKIFRHSTSLVLHYKRHTADKTLVCNVCGKGFCERGEMIQHYQLHRGEKPYVCDICGKGFRVRGHLTNHRLVHKKKPDCSKTEKKTLLSKSNLSPKSSNIQALAGFTTALNPGEIKLDTMNICNNDVTHCFWEDNEYFSCKDIFTILGAQTKVLHRGYSFILQLLPADLKDKCKCFVVFMKKRYVRKDLLVYLCRLPSFSPFCGAQKKMVLRSLLAEESEVNEPEATTTPTFVDKEGDTDAQFKPQFLVQEGKMFIDLPSALNQAGMLKHVGSVGYSYIDRRIFELGFTNVKACFLFKHGRCRTHVWVIAFLMLLKQKSKLGSSDLKEILYRDLLFWLEGEAMSAKIQ